MSKEKLLEILKDKELVALLKEALKEPEKPKRGRPKKQQVETRAKRVFKSKKVTSEFYNNYVDNLPVNENISKLDVLDAKNRLRSKKIEPRSKKFIKKQCEKCGKEFEGFFKEIICDSCVGGYRASR